MKTKLPKTNWVNIFPDEVVKPLSDSDKMALDELATVMERHKITLSYSNDDCGVCITINNKDALCEFLHDSDAASLIRKHVI